MEEEKKVVGNPCKECADGCDCLPECDCTPECKCGEDEADDCGCGCVC